MSGTLDVLRKKTKDAGDNLCHVAHTFRQCFCAAEGTILGQYDDWAILFECPAMDTEECCLWAACFKCKPSSRSQKIRSMEALKRHGARCHKAPKKRKEPHPDCDPPQPVKLPDSDDSGTDINCMQDCDSPPGATDRSEVEAGLGPIYQKPEQVVFDSVTDTDLQWVDCDEPFHIANGRKESSSFFFHQHNRGSTFGGVEYLVKRSLLQKELGFAELSQIHIPETHVELQLKIAKLAYMTTKTNRQLLADIMTACYHIGCEDGNVTAREMINNEVNKKIREAEYSFQPHIHFVRDEIDYVDSRNKIPTRRAHRFSTDIPENTNDIRKWYLEGKHAVVPNLPHPPVLENIPAHAYLSIIDCLEDFLAHWRGEEIEAITDKTVATREVVTKRCQSLHAKEILEEARGRVSPGTNCVAFSLTFWSDDAETNTFSKMNRNSSIWVKTLSICTVAEGGQQMQATYPIAVGRKSSSHDLVEKKHQEDLRDLRNGSRLFYIGSRRMCVSVQPAPFAILQDQPEKRSANKLMLGNSQFHTRWGWSADHSALYAASKLQPCTVCVTNLSGMIERREFLSAFPSCDVCLSYDISLKGNLGLSQLSADYPSIASMCGVCCPRWKERTTVVDGQRKLRPFQITYEGLKAAVDMAHHGFCHHDWSLLNCDAYLRVEGVNASYIEEVMEHAVNAYALQSARESQSADLPAMEEHCARHPDLYLQCPYAPTWERLGLILLDTIDAPMHLIFLGIVQSVMLKIQEWLKLQSKNASFIQSNGPYLLAFVNMSIDWLHLQPYKGGKFGGYVSEDYLGFSRVMKWFFQNVGESMVEKESNEAPTGLSPKKWLVKHNKAWLKIRGMSQEGKAAELTQRVAAAMAMGEDCPKPIPVPVLELAQVRDVVLALGDMLECIMGAAVIEETPKKARVLIKWFLHKFDVLDVSLRRGKDSPAIISKYNFMCLMNIPLIMERFGPIRNLWEGGFRGEGFLRITKPLVTQGLKLGWESHLMKKLLRNKALDTLLERRNGKVPSSLLSKGSLRERSRQFHKYDSQLQLVMAVNSKLVCNEKIPVSVLLLDRAGVVELYSVVGDYETLVPITMVNDSPTAKFGLFYYKLTAQDTFCHWEEDILQSAGHIKIGYAVLLPLLNTEEETEDSRRFAVVSSNWKSLSPDNLLSHLIDD